MIELSDNKKLIIAYVEGNPGCTIEDVLNFLVPWSNADDLRSAMALEAGWLVANGFLEKNKRNQGLSVSHIPPDGPDTSQDLEGKHARYVIFDELNDLDDRNGEKNEH